MKRASPRVQIFIHFEHYISTFYIIMYMKTIKKFQMKISATQIRKITQFHGILTS